MSDWQMAQDLQHECNELRAERNTLRSRLEETTKRLYNANLKAEDDAKFLTDRFKDVNNENDLLKRGCLLPSDTLETLRARAFKLLEGIEALENLDDKFEKRPVRWCRHNDSGKTYVFTRDRNYAEQLTQFVKGLL